MMVIDPPTGSIRHHVFPELHDFLERGDLLVLNDTRVIPARLIAAPKDGMTRSIELLLTRRMAPLRWECLVKPAKRVRAGDRLMITENLSAHILDRREGGIAVAEFGSGGESRSETDFWNEVEQSGRMPLPPYIRRSTEGDDEDRESYQTVYAAERGAIAAPTAGLHFTPEILAEIERLGVTIVRITLHVGIGTFRPVQVEDVEDHRMDTEIYRITESAALLLNEAVASERRIVAVGTTAVRTLESAADAGGRFRPGEGETDLFITPGYRFRVVRALLTNFHLPESTLIMLVSAFAGRELVLRAYREAIERNYLFYSYGDCMLIERRMGERVMNDE
jgi:S-adenosylmethionine:tRNA ribosyltransferase-isomerase